MRGTPRDTVPPRAGVEGAPRLGRDTLTFHVLPQLPPPPDLAPTGNYARSSVVVHPELQKFLDICEPCESCGTPVYLWTPDNLFESVCGDTTIRTRCETPTWYQHVWSCSHVSWVGEQLVKMEAHTPELCKAARTPRENYE